MSTIDPIQANRRAWNETAAIHERVKMSELLSAVQRDDFCTFDAVEQRLFGEIGLRDRAVLQPACNNARELISVKKAGAGRCVGFDISDAFIEQGRRLAKAGNVDIELVRTDVYEVGSSYSQSFDLVYVTVGALGWLPDVDRFFSLVGSWLKPDGRLFVYDMHPVLFLYDDETASPPEPRISRSYFRREPLRLEESSDYFDPSSVIQAPSYWYQHTLGSVLTAVLSGGLAIDGFEEYPDDISEIYGQFHEQPNALPMSYSLLARKPR